MDRLETALRVIGGAPTSSTESGSQEEEEPIYTASTVDARVDATLRAIHLRAKPRVPGTRPLSAALPSKADIAAGRLQMIKPDLAAISHSQTSLPTETLEFPRSSRSVTTLRRPSSAPRLSKSSSFKRPPASAAELGMWASLESGTPLHRVQSDMQLMSKVASSVTMVASERANDYVVRERHSMPEDRQAVFSASSMLLIDLGSSSSSSKHVKVNCSGGDAAAGGSTSKPSPAPLRRQSTRMRPWEQNSRRSMPSPSQDGAATEGTDLAHVRQHLWKQGMQKMKLKKVLRVVKLREEAPSEKTVLAADKWDSKHRVFSAAAEKRDLESNPIKRGHLDMEAEKGFRKSLNDVRRNRLVVAEKLVQAAEVRRYHRPAKAEAPFDLYKSIWAPRVQWAESRDLYDTEDLRMRRFDQDYQRALGMGLINIIMRNDDGDDDGILDEDGDGIPDEVEEVAEVMWRHNALLYALFNHYTSISHTLNTVSLNSWTTFIQDCQLVDKESRFCKLANFDQAFLQADALGKRAERLQAAKEAEEHHRAMMSGKTEAKGRVVKDQEHMLARGEFYCALVLIGINKYVLSGELTDVSEAMHRLLAVDVQYHLGKLVTTDRNVFRRCFCYPEATCLVLKRYERQLHDIFEYIASFGSGVTSATSGKVPTITLKEWLGALKHLEIMDLDLSERDALRCFSWSRMAVEDDQSVKGNYKNTVLPFEGFMEGLCRIAAQKALPTEDEVGGIKKVGEYMANMKTMTIDAYTALLMERRRPWASEPPDDFARAVDSVISLFLHAVRNGPKPDFGKDLGGGKGAYEESVKTKPKPKPNQEMSRDEAAVHIQKRARGQGARKNRAQAVTQAIQAQAQQGM